MRNLVVTSLILVLLISTATIVLSLLLVTKQGISVAASAAASEFKFDPNAKRFHSNINCNDFAQMTRSSNAADKATIVVDAHTYQVIPSWFATFGDDGQDFYKNNCANDNGSSSNNPISNIQLKSGENL